MPEYKSKYTGAEIDALLDKVDGRTSTPAPAEDKLITSGGVYTGLAGKTDKVTSPTAGNLPKLKADGSLEDSGKKTSDFVEKEEGKGLSTNDYTNEDKTKLGALPTKAGLDTALNAKEDKSNKVTSFSNPTDTQYPSAKLVSDSLDKVKADVNSLLTKAGIAEGIADTISAGTAQEFLQRQSGGDGVNCIKRIKGKTIAWNQLVQNGNFADGTRWTGSGATLSVSDGVADVLASGRYGFLGQPFTPINGHKYFFAFSAKAGASGNTFRAGIGGSGYFMSEGIVIDFSNASTTGFTRFSTVGTFTKNDSDLAPSHILFMDATDTSERAHFYIKDVIVTDLTLLGLGDLTADQFRALYPALYYAPASVLKSNDAAALLTDGRNQWDEVWEIGGLSVNGGEIPYTDRIRAKNFIPCSPNTQYYFRADTASGVVLLAYDQNKNKIADLIGSTTAGVAFTTPSGTAFIRFACGTAYGTTYNNDICINLSDPSFNGTYQPYWQRVLALRLSELTGIPEGGTEADRVTMFPNGAGGAGSAFDSIFVENGVTKARKMMARVDLGTPGWSYSDAEQHIFRSPFTDFPNLKPVSSTDDLVNAISARYTQKAYSPLQQTDNLYFSVATAAINRVVFINHGYSDVASFKAAMAGVYLEYELATPIVYTDLQYADGTPFTMPATILVDNGGTERIQAPEGAITPSAPFCCDSNYSISIANLVKKLNTL